MAAGVGIRVLPIRKQHDLHVHTLRKHHRDAAQGGVYSGRITVIHYGDIGGELVYEAYLLHGERSTAGSNDIAYAQLVHHHHINVALNQYAPVEPGNLRLGKVDAEQVAALDVDFRFRGVHVLGGVVGAQGAAAVGNDSAAERMYWEHHPLAELVLYAAVFPLHGEPGAEEILELVAGGKGGIHQGSAAGRCPAQAEALHGGVFQSPAAEISLTQRAALLGGKLLTVEFLGELHHQEQALVVLAFGDFLSRLLLLDDFDIVFTGKIAQSLNVGAVLLLHHETYGRARFPAAETLVYAFGRGDVEGGSLLVVEGTAGDVVRPATLQRHVIADNVGDLCCIQYEIDRLLRYHQIKSVTESYTIIWHFRRGTSGVRA